MPQLLFVDDVPELVRSWGRAFRRHHKVCSIPAHDVSQALEKIRTVPIDAAIVDFHLPDGNGFDVLRTLRSRSEHTPLILITALPPDLDRERAAVRLNVLPMRKPFKDGLLERWMRDAYRSLRRRRGMLSVLEHASSLTPREAEVLERYRRGLEYGEIADELDLGHSTVKGYIERGREKLGVRDARALRKKVRDAMAAAGEVE